MKKIISALFVLCIGTYSNSMNNKLRKKRTLTNTSTSQAKRRKKIPPFRKLAYPFAFANFINTQPRPIKYYGGKKRDIPDSENYTYEEIIDLRTKAPIINDTFYNLIKEQTEQHKPYFLAAILIDEKVYDSKTKQTIEKLGRHYHDAAYLIEWICTDNFYRKPGRKDPITGQIIQFPIQFFKIEKLHGRFDYFASEFDLKQDKPLAQFICSFIKSKMEKTFDLFALARFYHKGVCTKQNFKKAKEYYLQCIEQNGIEGINGLGDLYLDQKKYNKAEEQYLLGAQQSHSSSHLNLVYLFGINQSTLSLDKIISHFFVAQNNPVDFADYTKIYTDRWKIIKKEMQKRYIEIPDIDTLAHPFHSLISLVPYNNTDDDESLESDEESEEDTEIEMASVVEWIEPHNNQISEEYAPLLDNLANTMIEQDQEEANNQTESQHTNQSTQEIIQEFEQYVFPTNNAQPNNSQTSEQNQNTQQTNQLLIENDEWADLENAINNAINNSEDPD